MFAAFHTMSALIYEHLEESLDFQHAVYLCFTTATTIGYGDVRIHSQVQPQPLVELAHTPYHTTASPKRHVAGAGHTPRVHLAGGAALRDVSRVGERHYVWLRAANVARHPGEAREAAPTPPQVPAATRPRIVQDTRLRVRDSCTHS